MGDSPEPSVIDEETFARVFGGCQWSVVFIVAQDNKTYARLSFNVGPSGQMLIPIEVDYSQNFGAIMNSGMLSIRPISKLLNGLANATELATLPKQKRITSALPYLMTLLRNLKKWNLQSASLSSMNWLISRNYGMKNRR